MADLGLTLMVTAGAATGLLLLIAFMLALAGYTGVPFRLLLLPLTFVVGLILFLLG